MNISVWYQPSSSFPKWKSRGVTTLFGWENEGVNTPAALDAWCAAAKAAGLTYILQSSASAHWNDPECVGVFLEPDAPNADHPQTPAQMKTASDLLRTKTKKPLYLTLNGGAALTQPDTDIAAYCATADVVCWFSYPFNFGKGMGGISEITGVADKLSRVSQGKKIMLIAEASDQQIYKQAWTNGNDATGTPLGPKMRGPTGDEMGYMIGIALAHGVTSFCWFVTIVANGFGGFDGTNADQQKSMTNIGNALNTAQPAVVTQASAPALAFDSLTLNGIVYKRSP